MPDVPDLYKGGFAGLVRRQEKRQRRFDGVADILPPIDVDLAVYFTRILPPPEMPFDDAKRFSAHRKWLELAEEFQGQPEIFHLHAMLIAVSRRDDPPQAAITLFHRIWAEHGEQMAQALPVRWMISAATSFADIGESGDARAAGMGLSVLFDMIKLHDSERRLSGKPTRTPFQTEPGRKRFPLAFGMEPYAFKGGDLDKIMLARIWQICERTPTIRPLGFAMSRPHARAAQHLWPGAGYQRSGKIAADAWADGHRRVLLTWQDHRTARAEIRVRQWQGNNHRSICALAPNQRQSPQKSHLSLTNL